MKNNILINVINIILSAVFMLTVFLLNLNPLSLIVSFIVTVTNMLLAIYSMGIKEYPDISIGNFKQPGIICNGSAMLMQILLVTAALSSSLRISLLALFAVFVFIECIAVFAKKLFEFLKFHIAVTFSVSFATMVLYCILLAYRQYGFKIPVIVISIIITAVYVFLICREKEMLKVTAYSSLFSMALIILSIGNYTSQSIYSSILYAVNFTPVMFLITLSGFSIKEKYVKAGEDEISSVFVHFPIYGTGYFIGLLAVLGFPPFSLFFARLTVIQSSVTSGNLISTLVIAVIFIVSTYFVQAIVMTSLFGGKREKLLGMKENRYNALIIAVLLLIIVLLTVLIPGFIDGLISDARAYVMGDL